MARIKIRYFTTRPGRGTMHRHFWQPGPALRQAGFRTMRLSDDPMQAMREAEALNRRLDDWRANEAPGLGLDGRSARAAPGSKGARLAPGTMAELIQAYQRSRFWQGLRPLTQRGYDFHLRTLAAWAGSAPVIGISPRAVQDLYEAVRARTPARANHLIRVLRLLMEFARRQGIVATNPAARPGLIGIAPRQAVWPDAAVRAAIAAADAMGRPSIGTAILLAAETGQREGDVITLTWAHYQGGCFRLKQSKTGAPIEVPATIDLTRRLEALAKTATTIVADDRTGRPYTADQFRKAFATVRAAAIKTEGEDGAALKPAMADLRFMDLRRTAVVRLAEAGATVPQITAITGHRIERCAQIIETYLPRTRAMAAAGIASLEAARKKEAEG